MRFDERTEPLLEDIAQKIITCRKCALHEGRKNAVPGEGPQHARLMMVGEAPGAKEDESGRPFVGQAGKLMDELLAKSGIKREDTFITSVIKCRPPDNRNPNESEVISCVPYTLAQLDSICPAVIVIMGNVAYQIFAETFYLPKKNISDVRGKGFRLHSTGARILVPTYHPAALIYNRSLIPQFLDDMKTVQYHLKVLP
ncbi:MAG: uracil-DNA glycosylase [Candidatus Thermoplasmatota archaeon]|nr:uracil-DNA glycosylase [Candidatus Thermoplasmatota archaeon]